METAYDRLEYAVPELAHAYGPRVHILAHPALLTRLARICSPTCLTPEMIALADVLYREMASIVASAEFPRKRVRSSTRMRKLHAEGVYAGQIVEPVTRVVCVSIARAGIVPTLACYETFASIVNPLCVRQDHIFMNRRTSASGKVLGVDLSGSKLGGRIEGAMLVIPDPMAATGASASAAMDLYVERRLGRPRKIITMHLIVTPEYIRKLQTDHPGVVIYAIRLDRGLSKRDVLKLKPGRRWRDERGLNARQYIVPGGGGFGELLNNAEE